MLQSKPFVSLHELENMFPNVSSMTLRRDIEYFEANGECIKVRGGARSMKYITTSAEDSFSARISENTLAKEKVAYCALEYIESGRSIFLDSGTTILKLAYLMPDERVNIITTGPNIAMELAKKRFPIINIAGGMYNRDSISVSGNQAIKFLESVNIDVAFIVPSGVSMEDGFTCGNFNECELKSMVVQKAKNVVVLMDNSKLNKSLPYTFAKMEDVNVIVAERELSEEYYKLAKEKGVKIIIAD